jgi:CRP-like cAMP-binding protein
MTIVVIPTLSRTQNSILARLPAEILAALKPSLEIVALSAQQVVHVADRPITSVYFPESGWLSLSILMEDGSSIEVGTIGREGMLGYPILLGAEQQEVDATVQGAGWAWRIDADEFRRQLAQAPMLRDRLLRHLMAYHTQVARMAACHGSHYAGQRLARWLLMAHDRAEADAFPVTHDVISNLLGMRRAGVTNAAAMLQSAGVITYNRGNMVIRDRPTLEALACECYGHIRRSEDRLLCEPVTDYRGAA